MYSHLLFMRWLVLNVAIGTLGILAHQAGLLQMAWSADTTWVTTAILSVVAYGFVGITWRVAQCANWLDRVRRPTNAEAFRLKLASRVRPYVWLARCCVMLGFFGTVLGMVVALSLISSSGVQDAAMATQILTALVAGFNIALYTTLTGIVGYFVLMFNTQLLMGGYERLYTRSLEAPKDYRVRHEGV